MPLNPDSVHAVTTYYDGPRDGVADFRGHVHFFACIWDGATGTYSETFLLLPVPPDRRRSLDVMLRAGDWEAVARLLKGSFEAVDAPVVRATADFEVVEPPPQPGVLGRLQVHWSVGLGAA